ncbi:unnamed protein product [Closterium sp. Naga37s-1]|nr:unnamed protein product [Closterium sp. Naga37s-1]
MRGVPEAVCSARSSGRGEGQAERVRVRAGARATAGGGGGDYGGRGLPRARTAGAAESGSAGLWGTDGAEGVAEGAMGKAQGWQQRSLDRSDTQSDIADVDEWAKGDGEISDGEIKARIGSEGMGRKGEKSEGEAAGIDQWDLDADIEEHHSEDESSAVLSAATSGDGGDPWGVGGSSGSEEQRALQAAGARQRTSDRNLGVDGEELGVVRRDEDWFEEAEGVLLVDEGRVVPWESDGGERRQKTRMGEASTCLRPQHPQHLQHPQQHPQQPTAAGGVPASEHHCVSAGAGASWNNTHGSRCRPLWPEGRETAAQGGARARARHAAATSAAAGKSQHVSAWWQFGGADKSADKRRQQRAGRQTEEHRWWSEQRSAWGWSKQLERERRRREEEEEEDLLAEAGERGVREVRVREGEWEEGGCVDGEDAWKGGVKEAGGALHEAGEAREGAAGADGACVKQDLGMEAAAAPPMRRSRTDTRQERQANGAAGAEGSVGADGCLCETGCWTGSHATIPCDGHGLTPGRRGDEGRAAGNDTSSEGRWQKKRRVQQRGSRQRAGVAARQDRRAGAWSNGRGWPGAERETCSSAHTRLDSGHEAEGFGSEKGGGGGGPGAERRCPGAERGVPRRAERGCPGAERGCPGAERGCPGAERGCPGAERGCPGAERGCPSAERGCPGAERGCPGAGGGGAPAHTRRHAL